jgi:hypothetical protein
VPDLVFERVLNHGGEGSVQREKSVVVVEIMKQLGEHR